jgi:FKBP-type peptidyl-prolyl cis-trans isomerase FkpA
MKQTTFTLLLFAVIAMVSCRKNQYDPTIKQYDDDQIKAYISANGITGMVRDTSGMYYNIISPGTDTVIKYQDNLSMVFTIKSIDGKYVSTDTITNHYDGFAGHIVGNTFPIGLSAPGLQLAIHNLLNHHGGMMRLIVPSHLAYGVAGAGSGSISTAGRIAGNQCLDYYVHIISNQDAYDQLVIKNYMAANGLTNMTQDPAGFWYHVDEPGAGTVAITDNSTIIATYTTTLLNGTVASVNRIPTGDPLDIPNLVKGIQIGVKKYAAAGSLLTFLIPSSLAYGKLGTSVPPNSCIRYGVRVISTTP